MDIDFALLDSNRETLAGAMLSDYGLIATQTIPQEWPEIKRTTIDVAGMDGVLDISDSLGGVRYGNRSFKVTVGGLKSTENWITSLSEFANDWLGKLCYIQFESDYKYKYVGYFQISGTLERAARIGTIDLQFTCEPFKVGINEKLASAYTEDGIKLTSLDVTLSTDGTTYKCLKDTSLKGTLLPAVYLEDGSGTMTISEKTYALVPGYNRILDARSASNIEFTLKGSGTATLRFAEASL